MSKLPFERDSDGDLSRDDIAACIMTEYKAYNGPLRQLAGVIVPRLHGLSARGLSSGRTLTSAWALGDHGHHIEVPDENAQAAGLDNAWVMLMDDGGKETTDPHLAFLAFHAKYVSLSALRIPAYAPGVPNLSSFSKSNGY